MLHYLRYTSCAMNLVCLDVWFTLLSCACVYSVLPAPPSVCVCLCVCLCAGIDALLSMLRSLNEKVGTYDEEDEFKMLEQLLQSSHFMKAKSVRNAGLYSSAQLTPLSPLSHYLSQLVFSDCLSCSLPPSFPLPLPGTRLLSFMTRCSV